MSQSSFWLPGMSSLISPSGPTSAERRKTKVDECNIDIRETTSIS